MLKTVSWSAIWFSPKIVALYETQISTKRAKRKPRGLVRSFPTVCPRRRLNGSPAYMGKKLMMVADALANGHHAANPAVMAADMAAANLPDLASADLGRAGKRLGNADEAMIHRYGCRIRRSEEEAGRGQSQSG
jgi:hypothetical protein